MASHFSTIGFKVQNSEEFSEIARMAGEKGVKIETKRGYYYLWSLNNGVELWAQADKRENLIGLNPHFQGESKLKIKLDKKVERKTLTTLDASVFCYADATIENSKGLYPFVVDLPNFYTYNDIKLPQFTEIQISAFAHSIEIFDTEDEYFKSQNSEPKFSAESFIPSGLFSPEGENYKEPEAHAFFSGRILKVREIFNEAGERKFFYLVVKTFGGNFDTVIDIDLIEKYPKVDGIVSGQFWLSGKISDNYERKPLNFFGKLFKKSTSSVSL